MIQLKKTRVVKLLRKSDWHAGDGEGFPSILWTTVVKLQVRDAAETLSQAGPTVRSEQNGQG